jgi:hypothetical protein
MWSLLICSAMAACGGGGAADSPAASAVPAVSAAPASPLSAPAAVAPVALAASAGTSGRQDAAATSLGFSFDLPASRRTSAGVYAADGSLLRTLWRGEWLEAGRHTRQWDLRLDDGRTAAPGAVSVRVIHHDVQYRWQGVIGNSSAVPGQMPHRSFLPPASLAVTAEHLLIGLGYNEAQSALHGLRLTDPHRAAPPVTHVDPFIGFGLVASDGERLYAANTGGLHKGGFVVAFSLASGQQEPFAQGVPLCLVQRPDRKCYESSEYRGVAAARAEGEPLPTGLAVQRSGALMAVAYGAENRVRVFDKRSGQLLTTFDVPLAAHSANHLSMSASGDLWVVSNDAVLRYTALGTLPRQVQALTGLQRPLATATDPRDDDSVWVAEGGSRQQVRRWGRGGSVLLTVGRAGAWAGGAAVTPDSLCFGAEGGREHTAMAVDGRGQLWLVDTCNNRLLRFDAAGQPAADPVAWLPSSYVSAVDPTQPTRVFANFLEFEVDYSRALGTAGAWRLLRNWLPALPPALRDGDSANTRFGGFRVVTTLANGRTYAQLSVAGQGVLVELTAAGQVREVRRLTPPSANQTAPVLQPNGDLHHAGNDGLRQVVYRRALEGFGSSGEPRWADALAVLASVPMEARTPHHRMGSFAGNTGPRWPLTASGLVVYFNPGVDDSEGSHLGAAAVGSAAWAWQASPSGPLDGRGSFQTRSSDARIQYGGNVALTAGRSVLYGYHGEFYSDLGNGRVGQANQFMHFLDNGLFVGQFGLASTRAGAVPEPGLSGNAFSPTLVRVGGRSFLYHNDESSWGGVHRWDLLGSEAVVELTATGEPGSSLLLR